MDVPIKVVSLTSDYVAFWHQKIQPYIKASPTPRADKHWRWGMLFSLIGKLPDCKGYCIVIEGANGESLPAGMLLLLGDYPWLANHTKQSSFLWFLASAPDAAMQSMGIIDPPSLGRALVDTGVIDGYIAGHSGRIGLHAATKDLVGFYADKCNMINLGRNNSLPRRFVKYRQKLNNWPYANDGRFFYTDDRLAQHLYDTDKSKR